MESWFSHAGVVQSVEQLIRNRVAQHQLNKHAGIAQSVEQLIRNQLASNSSPLTSSKQSVSCSDGLFIFGGGIIANKDYSVAMKGETTPNTETLKLLSKLFDVSINTLLGSPRELICQCCGMPLEDASISKEPDGFFNEEYCKWCYADGAYMYHDMDDLIEVCVGHMAQNHYYLGRLMGYQSRQMAMFFVDMGSLISEDHLLRKIDRMVPLTESMSLMHHIIRQLAAHLSIPSACLKCS